MFLRGAKLFVLLGQIFLVALAAKKRMPYIYVSGCKRKCFVSDILKHSVLMLLSKVFDLLLLFKENILNGKRRKFKKSRN